MRLRLYDYLPDEVIDDDETPPQHVDYKRATTVRLEPVQKREHGIIKIVDYFGHLEELVVRETFSYETLPNSNLPQSRSLKIEWFDLSGAAHPQTKVWHKTYAQDAALVALAKQRDNIVLWMRAVMIGSPLERPARQLLENLSSEIQDYLLTGSAILRGAILMYQTDETPENEEDHWLDYELAGMPGSGVTYRLYMASEVRYGEAL